MRGVRPQEENCQHWTYFVETKRWIRFFCFGSVNYSLDLMFISLSNAFSSTIVMNSLKLGRNDSLEVNRNICNDPVFGVGLFMCN